MHPTSPAKKLFSAAAAAVCWAALGLPAAAQAADSTAAKDRAGRTSCEMTAPGTDRAACLREIAAARMEARRGGLTTPDSATALRNRLARCTVHSDADERALCERMVRGEGSKTGSIEGGGLLTELVTIAPAEKPDVKP